MKNKYDFESIPNRRGTGSDKWDEMFEKKPDVGFGVIPLSVADMEFRTAPEIVEGLKKFLDESVLGYTSAPDSYYESVIGWMQRRHGFSPKREWFVLVAGIVPALKQLVPLWTKPGESILIMTPVYYPFRDAARRSDRGIVESRLVEKGDTYEIDFNDFEEKAKRDDVTLCLLCSPHNPCGRVWTREELERICDICLFNGVYLISDEIHFDLIMPGYKHTSVAELDDKYLQNSAICTAPSKTFNLAGMKTANVFVPDPDRRAMIERQRGYFALNILGYKACELAYNECEGWLKEALSVMELNRQYVCNFIEKYLPQLRVFKLEGTYLLWIDCRSLGMTPDELESFMINKAEIFFDEGYIFGKGGEGFERLNLACPHSVIEAAMARLKNALDELEKAR